MSRLTILYINDEYVQRDYFSFYGYDYKLDVTKQKS